MIQVYNILTTVDGKRSGIMSGVAEIKTNDKSNLKVATIRLDFQEFIADQIKQTLCQRGLEARIEALVGYRVVVTKNAPEQTQPV